VGYYDDIKQQHDRMPAEQKLGVLRPEMIRYLNSILGYSRLIQHYVSQTHLSDLPEGFRGWCDIVPEHAERLLELIHVLTDAEEK